MIFLSFANIKGSSFAAVKEGVLQSLVRLYGKYAYVRDKDFMSRQDREFFDSVTLDMSDTTAALAISSLSDYLSRYYGKKVLILLDEYDTPLQEAYVNGFWKETADFMRVLFKVRQEGEQSLEETVAAARQQIQNKGYAKELEARGIAPEQIWCYGFAFQGKKY